MSALLALAACLLMVFSADAHSQQARALGRASQDVLEASTGRYAVIVGVDQYDDPAIQDLQFSANDARAIAEALILSGAWPRDHVVVMTPEAPDARKPTRNNVLAELGRLSNLKGADTILFYFSGHGSASNRSGDRENFLYPMDTRPSVPEDTAIEVKRVLQVLDGIDADRKIAIFDACRNQLEAGTRGAGGGGIWSAPHYTQSNGLRILYATCFECFSWEDEDAELGVMTRYLLDGLDGAADGADNSVADGVIGFDELYSHLYASVLAWSNRTGNRQIPTLGGERAGGDFAVVPVRGQLGQVCPATSATLESAARTATDAWRGPDPEAFGVSSRRADAQLRCLEERIRPDAAAAFHELQALRKFEVQDEASALASLAAAAQVRSGRPPLANVENKPRDLEALVSEASGISTLATAPTRAPRGVRYVFDGATADRPLDRPAVAQAVSCGRSVQWTRWLLPDDPLPATVVAQCAGSARTALGASAGGLALSAGGLYVASLLAQQSFYRLTTRQDPVFDDQLTPSNGDQIRAEADRRAKTANVLGYAAEGAGAVALGLGLGFALTFRF